MGARGPGRDGGGGRGPWLYPVLPRCFLAHVIADYLLQTEWMVANKHRARAIGLHIGAVFLAMPLVTLTFSPWFVALAGLHLAIDLTKTHLLRGGLGSYWPTRCCTSPRSRLSRRWRPGIWRGQPAGRYRLGAAVLPDPRHAPVSRRAAASTPSPPCFGSDPEADGRGLRIGWIERAALSVAVAAGAPWAMLGVLAAKSVHVARALQTRDGSGRARMIRGSAVQPDLGPCLRDTALGGFANHRLSRGARCPTLRTDQTRRTVPMFGIPGKQAVTITEAASRQIAKLMARDGSQGAQGSASRRAAARAWNTPWITSPRSTRMTRSSNRAAPA